MELLPEPRTFENADFIFLEHGVLAELKEIETEFSSSPAFAPAFEALLTRLVADDPSWRPLLFGGSGEYPLWFHREFVRLFRAPISRILKKANRQLRDTKLHFNIETPTGILLLVNDGFTALGPRLLQGLVSSLLLQSYSSIDCFVYLTVNRYVEVVGSDTPRLLWAPTYSDRASDSLVHFVDDLGRQWFDFLEERIGPFTTRREMPQPTTWLRGARAILLPGERDRSGK